MPGKLLCSSLIVMLLISSLPSCDLINPPEPIPSYVRVDTVMVDNNTDYGSDFHAISDLWVYVNGTLIGTYDVPFTVPVLPSGNQIITMEAGIKENGQIASRRIYPFYTSFRNDTLLPPADTITLNPVYKYEDVDNAFFEDFEDLGTGFETTEASDTVLMTANDSNCMSGKCGYFAVDISRPNFDCRMAEPVTLPPDSKVYAEISYKCSEQFTIGVFAMEYSGGTFSDVRYPLLTLYKSEDWNKVYVNLTDVIAQTPTAQKYRLFFSASHSDENDVSTGEVYLDNIKILHY
ncbi:MAG: hypothetical protein ACLFM1_04430 [Bacteroidales bacterium]